MKERSILIPVIGCAIASLSTPSLALSPAIPIPQGLIDFAGLYSDAFNFHRLENMAATYADDIVVEEEGNTYIGKASWVAELKERFARRCQRTRPLKAFVDRDSVVIFDLYSDSASPRGCCGVTTVDGKEVIIDQPTYETQCGPGAARVSVYKVKSGKIVKIQTFMLGEKRQLLDAAAF